MTADALRRPPCVVNDSHEPNNSAGAATAIGLGVTTGALCKTDAALPQDIDFYTVTVPNGKQLNVTLSNLPADYDLYVQRAGQTLAISRTAGLANETIALPNYEGDGDYTIVVFSGVAVNNPAPYTLTVGLTDAPLADRLQQRQCLAVDPDRRSRSGGQHSQSQATPLTVGSAITGALCFQDDVDFFCLQRHHRPAVHPRPAGAPGRLRAAPLPARRHVLQCLQPHRRLDLPGAGDHRRDRDLGRRRAYAQPDADAQPPINCSSPMARAASTTAGSRTTPTRRRPRWARPGRVNATLCAANDVDNYRLTATAGQTLTVNYPANASGAVLRLLSGAGAEVGRILPGSQGNFVLPAAGNYTLVAANSALTSTDAAYMFQWLLDAPQVAPDEQYLYYTDGLLGQLYRVALSADHTTEPIFLTTTLAIGGPAIAGRRVRGDCSTATTRSTVTATSCAATPTPSTAAATRRW